MRANNDFDTNCCKAKKLQLAVLFYDTLITVVIQFINVN